MIVTHFSIRPGHFFFAALIILLVFAKKASAQPDWVLMPDSIPQDEVHIPVLGLDSLSDDIEEGEAPALSGLGEDPRPSEEEPVQIPDIPTIWEEENIDINGKPAALVFEARYKGEYVMDFPNVFTPNDDGVNDYWVIGNMRFLNDHVVTVFDRAGQTVYRSENYRNDWDGHYRGRPLPEDTYFYTFEDLVWGDRKSGFIQIIRN